MNFSVLDSSSKLQTHCDQGILVVYKRQHNKEFGYFFRSSASRRVGFFWCIWARDFSLVSSVVFRANFVQNNHLLSIFNAFAVSPIVFSCQKHTFLTNRPILGVQILSLFSPLFCTCAYSQIHTEIRARTRLHTQTCVFSLLINQFISRKQPFVCANSRVYWCKFVLSSTTNFLYRKLKPILAIFSDAHKRGRRANLR